MTDFVRDGFGCIPRVHTERGRSLLKDVCFCLPLGAHLRGVRQHTLLKGVLRRLWEGFWGSLRRVLGRRPPMDFTVKKGSQKGFLEGVFQKVRPSESTTPQACAVF